MTRFMALGYPNPGIARWSRCYCISTLWDMS